MINRIKNSISFRYKNYRYKKLTSKALQPKFDSTKLNQGGFYSQCGQDKWLANNVFADKQNGVFVDIGAHDGKSFSNSYYFEKQGWTGLAVEPLPDIYKKLSATRNCICVNACVSEQAGIKIFRKIEGYSEMLSGLVDEYDERHLQRIDREVKQYGGSYVDTEINCLNINNLLSDHGLHNIDYLSIDVEGGELAILNSLDFSAFNIAVIGVENNYSDYRIPQLLKRQGFQLRVILGDEIYINLSQQTTSAIE